MKRKTVREIEKKFGETTSRLFKRRNPDLLRPTTWDGVAFVLLALAPAKKPGFSSYV